MISPYLFPREIVSTSQAIRDPVTDALLTPKNAALIIIDYQPVQVNSIKSMDHEELIENIVRVAKTAKLYGVPIVLSTVNAKTGVNQPTIPQLQEVLQGIPSYDRTTINAWEDVEFLAAVKATGRKEADHERAVDGGVPHLPDPQCDARGIRGLSSRRCRRRHLSRGAQGRAQTRQPGRREAGQLGAADSASFSETGTVRRQ